MDDAGHDAEDAVGALSWPVVARQLGGGLLGLVLVVSALAWALGPAIERVSQAFVAQFGLPGVFLGCLLADATMLPKEPVLLAGYAGGVGFWTVLVVGAAGSMASAVVGWGFGLVLGRTAWVQRRFVRHGLGPLMDRHGTTFLAVVAVVPFPFSVAVWAAAVSGMPFGRFLLIVLLRIPKTLISLLMVAGGWSFGAWLHAAS